MENKALQAMKEQLNFNFCNSFEQGRFTDEELEEALKTPDGIKWRNELSKSMRKQPFEN